MRYNRFHKGKAIQVNQRGYRIPFYDRPPASDSYVTMGLWIAIFRCKQGEMSGSLNFFQKKHGNPQPSSPNGIEVGEKVQRLGQRSQSDNVHQRPGTLPFSTRATRIERFSQSMLGTPSGTNSIRDDMVGKIDLFGPSGHRLSFISESKKMITAKITSLRSRCIPYTVTWFIIAVIILTFKSQAFRSQSHIRKKVFKAMLATPALADCDGFFRRHASAVTMPLLMIWRITAILHSIPSVILRRLGQPMGLVAFPQFLSAFPMITSAGHGMTRSQARSSNHDLFPVAFASASPVVFAACFMTVSKSDHCQSAKLLTDQAFMLVRHELYSIILRAKGQDKVHDIVRATLKDVETGRNDQSLFFNKKKRATRPSTVKVVQCRSQITHSIV